MNRLTNLLADDGTVLTAWSSIQDTLYLNALAKTGFDAVTLDMQHGMQTDDSVIRGVAAIAPTGKPVVVRIPVGRFDFASKALDAGAHAVIAPMVNTVEDARQLAAYTKYVPAGSRSYGPTQAIGVLDVERNAYVLGANEHTLNFAMIETKQAVENLEAILDVDGVDGVFCGPADLSISVRGDPLPDAYGKETIDIVKRMANEARARGKIAAAFCSTTQHAELVQDLGYRFIALGFDATYLSQGADTELNKLSFR